MPFGTITSTSNTFGTISGDVGSNIPGTLSGSVGVPGPQGPTGSQGPQGIQGVPGVAGAGVPAGGLTAQFLQKTSNTSYATDWVTLPAYLPLAGGTMNVNAAIDFSDTTFSTVSEASGYGFLVSSAANVNLASSVLFDRVFVKNATSQTTLKPTGVEFPDLTLQTTAGLSPATASATYQTLAGMSAYAPLASPAFTGDARAVTATFGDNDTSISTTAFVQAALAGGTAIAKSLEVEVRNQSGASIPAGSVVYISGATGSKPLITLSQANNDANSAQTMGFTKTAIANNAFGLVIIRGEVENLNTSALTEGVQLYLSPTVAGAYTTTKPSAPLHLVYVGIVIRSHPTLGTILVAVQNGYELNELHDVAIGTLADNDLLAYELSTDLWKNKSFATLGLLTSATAATTYAPLASPALTGNVTITTNSSSPALFITQTGAGNILTLHDLVADTNFVAIDQNGKINTIIADATTAGLNIPHASAAPASPINGDIWTTTGGLFTRINGATVVFAGLGTANTFTNNTVFSSGSLSFGTSVSASTINVATGATTTGLIKALNLGTGGLASSTTNITVGSTTGTSTTTLNGTTNGVTAAADTNSVALATTAYVVGQAGSATPVVNGTAVVGTSLRYARQDHVHPTDTSRAALASPTFTGVPLSTTAAVDTNTTQIATTAYVVGQGYAKLASPSFSGAPSLPTGTTAVTQTAGNNTTALATTAFVTAAVPALSATTDVNAPTSTTKATSPKNVVDMLLHAGYNLFYQGAGSSSTSGTGSIIYGYGGRWKEYVSPNAGTAGYALGVYDTEQVSYGYTAYSRSAAISLHDWTKKIWISGRCMIGHPTISTTYDGDANTFARISLGGYTAFGAGDMSSAQRGVGFKVAGGGTAALQLVVTNGTAVTTVTSSFTPTLRQVFDWKIYSDGAGNVTLYVNDSQVATTTAGPSTTGFYGLYMEGVDTTVSSTKALIMENFGTKIYHGV